MPRIIYPSLQAPVLDQSQEPEQVTESRWHQPWSEPARRVFATALIVSGPIWPLPVPTPSAVSVASWERPWSEPTRAKLLTSSPDLAYGYFTPVPQVVNFGWFSALSEPFPKIATRQQPFAVSYSPFTPAPVSIGWFNPFSEPVRTRVSLYAAPDYAAPIAPIVPITVPLFGWYAEFSIPTFPVHLRTSADFAWGYFTPAPTPPPPPPTPVVGSFSVGPQMITGQGSPPGEVYISPPKKGKRGTPKGTRIASDYPKWPGWGKY